MVQPNAMRGMSYSLEVLAEHLSLLGPVQGAEMKGRIEFFSTCLSGGRKLSSADGSNYLVQSLLQCFHSAGKSREVGGISMSFKHLFGVFSLNFLIA